MIGMNINDIFSSPKPSMDINWHTLGSQHMGPQVTSLGSKLWWLRCLHPKKIRWWKVMLITIRKRILGNLLLAEYTPNYFSNNEVDM